jgi:hypothetical protein
MAIHRQRRERSPPLSKKFAARMIRTRAEVRTASNFYAFVVSGALSGIVMIGAAVAILQTGVFSHWLGWAGALIGSAAIVGSAALVENDPAGLFASINAFAWLAYFLWIAALSIALIRGGDTPTNA